MYKGGLKSSFADVISAVDDFSPMGSKYCNTYGRKMGLADELFDQSLFSSWESHFLFLVGGSRKYTAHIGKF